MPRVAADVQGGEGPLKASKALAYCQCKKQGAIIAVWSAFPRPRLPTRARSSTETNLNLNCHMLRPPPLLISWNSASWNNEFLWDLYLLGLTWGNGSYLNIEAA